MQDQIRKFLNNKESKKINVSIAFEENDLIELDKIIDKFNQINKKQKSTRSILVRMAVKTFIEEANQIIDEKFK